MTRRELLPMVLVLLAIVCDAAGASTLAFYCLLAAIPAIVVAGLAAIEEQLEGGASPYRRHIAMLHPVALVLVLVAAALRAPLRAEGTTPRAAISAAVACLVVFAAQALIAGLPALGRRVRPGPSELPQP